MKIEMRNKIIETIEKTKLIVIVRNVRKEQLMPMTEAIYRGGARLIEFTYSSKTMDGDADTADWIGRIARAFEGRMFVGAGTVINVDQVEKTHAAGGCFIISPNTDPAVIRRTKELGMVSIPGALTPTEIVAADHAGADFVKLFPVTSMGPEYVKAVKAPLSHIKLLAVGGVDEKNIAEYQKAGACGFGIGSNIVNKKMIEAGEFDKITELAKEFLSALN